MSPGCLLRDQPIVVQSGLQTGKVDMGINTRFGEAAQAGLDMTRFPPDLVVNPELGTCATTNSQTLDRTCTSHT